jgi:hypothetical protein
MRFSYILYSHEMQLNYRQLTKKNAIIVMLINFENRHAMGNNNIVGRRGHLTQR